MKLGRLLVAKEGDGQRSLGATVALELVERVDDELDGDRGDLGLRVADGDIDDATHAAAKTGLSRVQSSDSACGRTRVSPMTGMKL